MRSCWKSPGPGGGGERLYTCVSVGLADEAGSNAMPGRGGR